MFAIKNGFLNSKSFYNVCHFFYRHHTNEVGVQMIDEKFRALIFCQPKKMPDKNCVEEAKKHLQIHNLDINSIDRLKDVENLRLPDLKGFE